jgi:hypothetical protein
MRYLRFAALLGICLFFASFANAQRVFVGVGAGPGYYYGPAPVCAYGYYGYYPYACAPYGYYGPEWFVGGVFIGAGPWYHGFHGRGYWGPRYYERRGFEGRFRGDGRDRFRGGYAHEGFVGRGFARGGEFRGGFHGGGGFRGGGGFHDGGHGGHR